MLHAFFNEVRKVIHIGLLHVGGGDILTQHFARNRVKQQSRGRVGVVGVFLNQGTSRQNRRLVHLIDGHAVIQITQGLGDDGFSLDVCPQIRARITDALCQSRHIQSNALTAVHHMQSGRRWRGLHLLLSALLRAPLTV